MTAAGSPLTIAVAAWDGRNISLGIEDEALIWPEELSLCQQAPI